MDHPVYKRMRESGKVGQLTYLTLTERFLRLFEFYL